MTDSIPAIADPPASRPAWPLPAASRLLHPKARHAHYAPGAHHYGMPDFLVPCEDQRCPA